MNTPSPIASAFHSLGALKSKFVEAVQACDVDRRVKLMQAASSADERSATAFVELSAPTVPARDTVEAEQLRSALDREISLLPARRREIVVLRCVHDLSYKEIAEVMNIAPQTVANQLSSALATLRLSLRELLD